jgi:ferritin-like metal-binding protein YciE
MKINNFKDMFLAELQELASVEGQLADALLRLAGAASHPELKRALIHHRAETETQRARLETILAKHGADPAAHVDQAMQALITETMKMLTILTTDDLRDAGLIASAQKLEHYEIAAYGTDVALAQALGEKEVADLLSQTLEEEKQTDLKLTEVTRTAIMPEALTGEEEEGGGGRSGGRRKAA